MLQGVTGEEFTSPNHLSIRIVIPSLELTGFEVCSLPKLFAGNIAVEIVQSQQFQLNHDRMKYTIVLLIMFLIRTSLSFSKIPLPTLIVY